MYVYIEKITTIKLNNFSTQLSVCEGVGGLRKFKICPLSKFQVYNTVSLTIYHHGVQQIPRTQLSCRTETLHPLTDISPLPPLPNPDNHHPTLAPVHVTVQIPHISEIRQCLCVCLAYFTQHSVLQVCPHCHKWKNLLIFRAE